MKVILPIASKFKQIVGRQKQTDGERYRLMTYVVQQPVADGLLLYNMLTCSLVLLTPDEAADLTAQRELIDRWFLVPEDHDDRKLCRQVRQMAALLKPAAKTISTYIILPTTGCNARCFYCFEKGSKPVTMTAETASKVVRYIVAHRGSETVHISWFGGEPLVNAKAIDQICTELSQQGVPFRSEMISNGYLFDAEMAQRAKDLWQLQLVQITLDGTAQTYNRVKDYVYRDVNAFERVLQNIGLLTGTGIHTRIRLNVSKHNIGEMAELVELLHKRFGADEYLTVTPRALFEEEDNAELFAQRMQLEQQIAACGFHFKGRLPKSIRVNRCMTDVDGGRVVIAPDGHLGKCHQYIDREFFGQIDSEERNDAILRKFKERRADIEDCATCFYYPQCIRLVMCKKDINCTSVKQQEFIHDMRTSMKDEYERYLNNEDHYPDSITV